MSLFLILKGIYYLQKSILETLVNAKLMLCSKWINKCLYYIAFYVHCICCRYPNVFGMHFIFTFNSDWEPLCPLYKRSSSILLLLQEMTSVQLLKSLSVECLTINRQSQSAEISAVCFLVFIVTSDGLCFTTVQFIYNIVVCGLISFSYSIALFVIKQFKLQLLC